MTGDAMRDVIGYQVEFAYAEGCNDGGAVIADRILAAITAAPASARLALARAITPDTHAVVPVHATDAMVDAAIDRPQPDPEGLFYRAIYAAMIAAARGADAEGGK